MTSMPSSDMVGDFEKQKQKMNHRKGTNDNGMTIQIFAVQSIESTIIGGHLVRFVQEKSRTSSIQSGPLEYSTHNTRLLRYLALFD